MSLASVLEGYLPAVGGVLGICTLLYFGFMLYYAKKRDETLQRIEVTLARIEGIVLGKKNEVEL